MDLSTSINYTDTYHTWEYHNIATSLRDQWCSTMDWIPFHLGFDNGWHYLSFPEICLLVGMTVRVARWRTKWHRVSQILSG